MTEALQVAAGPRRHWRFGRYTLARHARGKWDLSDGCLGTGNHRTPVHAWFAMRRWRAQAPLSRPGSQHS